MEDAAHCLEGGRLRHFCHGNSIVSTVSDTVLATDCVPPGVGIFLRNL